MRDHVKEQLEKALIVVGGLLAGITLDDVHKVASIIAFAVSIIYGVIQIYLAHLKIKTLRESKQQEKEDA